MNAQPKQRNDAWHAGRKGRITASKVGKILGLSKYGTRDDAMREFVREFFDAPREFDGNDATRYGEAHEGDAIDAYEQRFGALVQPCGLIPHPEHDFLAASPDGLVGDLGLVECKCPFRARYTTPSAEYVAQMQLQMACTGREWTDFAVWREGEPLIVERVNADPEWLPSALPTLRAFLSEWMAICADDKRAAPYLADKERDDETWRNLVAEWRDAKRHADEAAEWEKRARADLVNLAPQGAKGCGVQVIRVERTGSIKYAEALKSMLPDVDLSPWRAAPTVSYTVKDCR